MKKYSHIIGQRYKTIHKSQNRAAQLPLQWYYSHRKSRVITIYFCRFYKVVALDSATDFGAGRGIEIDCYEEHYGKGYE